jgi:hypothetical protein
VDGTAARLRTSALCHPVEVSRLRPWLLLLGATVLLAAGCTGTNDGDGDGDRDSGPGATTAEGNTLEPSCPAPDVHGSLPSASAANKIVAAARLPAWEAADIGASTRLSDGRIVWIFGDTLREAGGSSIVANSMLISSRTCISQVLTPDRGPVVPDARPGVVHWPMSVLAHRFDGTEHLAVLCSRVRRGTSGDGFDFTFLGTSVAVFDIGTDGVPQLESWREITPDDPDLHQINWGAASFHDGRSIYAYGTRLPAGDAVFGRELYVARVPLASPTDRSTYEFWDGRRWQGDPGRAVAVLPSQGGVSQTLSVHQIRPGTYLAVSKRDGDLGDFVYTWAAPTPHGPWSPHKGVAAPSDFDGGELEYAPLAHPEVPMANGRLLVSVSRNTTDFQRLLDNPGLGVPRFVQVEMPET